MTLSRRNLLAGAGAIGLGPLTGGAALTAGQGAGQGFDRRVVQSGHSLTDPLIEPLRSLLRLQAGARGEIVKSTIPGSPMDWRWHNDPGSGQPYLREPRVMAGFDLLVITERTPLSGTMDWHDSPGMALQWATHAWTHGAGGAGAPTILYATWVGIGSGPDDPNPWNDPEGHLTFRERMPLEMARWDSIQAHVNANRPREMAHVKMIPGPLVFAAAHDAILAGEAPGITRLSELFSDDVHLNDLGAYLIALAHFAVIYDVDPVGLAANIPPRTGPDPQQALWMQKLVAGVLAGYGGNREND
ncbi:hypothetical protein [Pseudogemmobacter sonorensis]|uniref:hypothetical protein n=1 Tax=Pseudogemmobacter sonorensis TaxID=2989681 RepID=UPI0036857A1C